MLRKYISFYMHYETTTILSVSLLEKGQIKVVPFQLSNLLCDFEMTACHNKVEIKAREVSCQSASFAWFAQQP